MKFIFSSTSLLRVTALLQCLTFAACKTTHSQGSSALQSEGNSVQGDDSAWLLLPNLANVFGKSVVDQTIDAKNPSAYSALCFYFDTANTPDPSTGRQSQVFQLWLENGEYCGSSEKPSTASNQHQFLDARALAIKEPTDTAWIIYLGDRAIGSATLDFDTGLPLIQSLCSGPEYEKACRVKATSRSIQIESSL